MLERFRFSKPLAKEERLQVKNNDFWWNSSSLDEESNEINDEQFDETTNDPLPLSESYENYMQQESEDIAKLHEKLNILRKKLYNNLNEKESKDTSEFDLNENISDVSVNSNRSKNGSDKDSQESEDDYSNSDPIVYKTKNSLTSQSKAPTINSQNTNKLPFSKSSKYLVDNKSNNINIESIDNKAKMLIDRR